MGIQKTCPECKGSSKVGGLFSKSACVTCDGKGFIIDPTSLSSTEKTQMGDSQRAKGTSLLQQGKPDMAIKKFNLALAYNTSSFESHVGRIICAGELKEYNAACNYADTMTNVFLTNGNAHYFRCSTYYQRSRTKEYLGEQIDDLRIAYREIELALHYKCTFADAKELQLYLRDWLKECESTHRTNTNYSLFGPNR
jgi:tetratricopeptide (TPR) repeat protein